MLEVTRAAFAVPISTSQFSCVGERSGNQDAIGYHLDEHNACFVVSDGVGGNAGGELAARIAVDTALNTFVDHPSVAADDIRHAVKEANDAILARQRELADQSRMSATIVSLFVDRASGHASWAHVGDSRLYWFRRGALMQRTEDHSLSERSGEAATGNGANGGERLVKTNLLYRALGARATAETTVSAPQQLADGDAFLLCTDGLWQLISQQVMERSLQLADSAEEWLALLRRAAEAKADKSQDNYSALAVWVGFPQQVTLAGTAVPPRVTA
ncbi:PP2C family serine/threonine-protein phosphatase [Variovorax sp. 770b2]|uniref:PP2C family protein-serine/threonine phosphatase n=1 Tax=Variovorax sp. 770b2 TaxID=1566271 RepID=UPI0008E4554D|nr:protein phosphatase 2C domain-containing protein [Variovorax sp. 770b2]SFQ19800.1 Serine/threonine protein phosphatase PrpC [Variovorax sp. 770b2]